MDAQHSPIFQQYPMLGYIYTLSTIILGILIPVLPSEDAHIPPIVMETLQCLVWASGTVVAVFTLYGMWKKSKDK